MCRHRSTIPSQGILCLFLFFTCAGNAAQSGDFTYEVAESTVTITKYTGPGGSVAIPATIDGMPVTRIGDRAFFLNANMTSVTLPDSVTTIGDYAFHWCDALTSIAIGNSVTTIGGSAFSSCSQLTSIVLPNSVTSIGDGALSGCDGLTTITIGDGLTTIGGYAFSGCSGLRSIVLPNSVTTIGRSAFYGCTGLTSIALPNSLASIGAMAFVRCSGLTKITVDALNPLYSDKDGIVLNKAQTTLIQYPVGRVGGYDIPNGVTTIGDYAFGDCAGLSRVTLPNSLTNMGGSAFSGCSGLTNIAVDVLNPQYADRDGVVFTREQTALIQYPVGRVGGYDVPSGVTGIGDNAFGGCSRLSSITLPSSVTTIGDGAFMECTGLTSIVLPDSLTSIGNWTFQDCTALRSVTLPKSLISIGRAAFWTCTALTSVNLPNSVTTIGNQAFYRCSALANATSDAATIGDEFSGLQGLRTVTLGSNVTSIGASAFAGCGGLRSITIPNSVTNIGSKAFLHCAWLTSLALPNNLTSVPEEAFRGCTRLTSLALPESLIQIGDYALSGCAGLRSLTLPDNLTTIGYCAFQGCSGLASITVPKGVTSIGIYAFSGCTGLMGITVDRLSPHFSDRDGVLFNKEQTELIQHPGGKVGNYSVPDGVFSIGYGAFEGCARLTSLTVPESVTSIADEAFRGCAGLASVTLSDGVTSIGRSAFAGCAGLRSIILPRSVSSIGDAAFSGCIWLTSAFFEGNAPTLGVAVFDNARKVIAFRLADTTGWGDTFGGRPTAIWVAPPSYRQWADTSGLATKYPDASAEQDDADQDGLTNGQERTAGTDPTDRTSTLDFEALAKPGDLIAEDKAPLEPGEFALYFQSVPGQSYEIQSTDAVGGSWSTAATLAATTTQKRVRLAKPAGARFYRVATPGVTAGMVLIPAGSFTMGDSFGEGASYELPTQSVEVSAFYIDKDEVMSGLWDEVKTWAVGHGYGFDNEGSGLGPNHPVENVDWYDVVKWCNARSEKEGRVAAYYTDEAQTQVYRTGQVSVESGWVKWNGGYRLPTEAEWEKAARGGVSGKRFPWGDTITHNEANYISSTADSYDISSTRGYNPGYDDDPMPYTSPVGSFPAGVNGYGLKDMAGNVAEWCWDWHGAYSGGSVTNPRGPTTGSYRVYRGGGWSSNARDSRTAARGFDWPTSKGDGLGFRSVLALAQ